VGAMIEGGLTRESERAIAVFTVIVARRNARRAKQPKQEECAMGCPQNRPDEDGEKVR
jgi:hypothetical protein